MYRAFNKQLVLREFTPTPVIHGFKRFAGSTTENNIVETKGKKGKKTMKCVKYIHPRVLADTSRRITEWREEGCSEESGGLKLVKNIKRRQEPPK